MNNTIKQLKEVPGMVSCVLEHEIKNTKATFRWDGPKIDPLVWQQVLAFFKWTYTEHKSESQVRLFVNHVTREWAAWAFPQEARTGMSAKELDTEDTKTQRAQFSDADGWIYFGTVHHHCSGCAFQSGTDETNEKNQDGLHITVGKMDEKLHDLHCRLYISGHRFDPKMNWFWDTGPFFAGIPRDMQIFLVDGCEDRIARMQMCQPAAADVEFPAQWKGNVIDIKPVTVVRGAEYNGGLGYQGHWTREQSDDFSPTYTKSAKQAYDTPRDLWIARKELLDYFAATTRPDEKKADAIVALEELQTFPYIVHLFENLYRNDVSLEGLTDYMLEVEEKLAERQLKAELEKGNHKGGKKKKGNHQQDGIPDYNGTETEHGHIPGNLPI